MGATLVMASEKLAYTLTDRATWLALSDPRGLAELASGDPKLRNNYGVMVVSAAKHPGVKAELALQLADWLTGAAGREAIAAFQIGGKQVFFLE
jgi:tungstate transport system substrate-binding protein